LRSGTNQHSVPAQWVQTPASVQPGLHEVSSQTEATQIDVDLASKLIAAGVTTPPIETVIAVLAASRRIDQRCRQSLGDQLHDRPVDPVDCKLAVG
jgi:hypothetical protein